VPELEGMGPWQFSIFTKKIGHSTSKMGKNKKIKFFCVKKA